MNAQELSNKIKKLIGNNELDQAIIELMKLSAGSDWTNNVINQKGRFHSLEARIISGTISFDQSNIEENKIRESLISIADKLSETKSQNLDNEIDKISNWNEKLEVCSVLEKIYETINSILIENQEVLAPIFYANSDEAERIHGSMMKLYHIQESRGNFARWITYLNLKIQSPLFESSDKDILRRIINYLQEMTVLLYKDNSNANENEDAIIHQIRTILRPSKKHIIIVLERHGVLKVRELRSIIIKYLDSLRLIETEIGIEIEQFKNR